MTREEYYGSIQTFKENSLEHHGVLGQKWGIRRYQNPDGTLTDAGKRREAKDAVRGYWCKAAGETKQTIESKRKLGNAIAIGSGVASAISTISSYQGSNKAANVIGAVLGGSAAAGVSIAINNAIAKTKNRQLDAYTRSRAKKCYNAIIESPVADMTLTQMQQQNFQFSEQNRIFNDNANIFMQNVLMH